MNTKLVISTITNLIKEIDQLKGIKERRKSKYISDLKKLERDYNTIEVPDYFKAQYTQLNSKGNELVKDIRQSKDRAKIENDIPVYIRYLKASLMDFQDKTNNLRYYLFSFYITSALFFALTPQFYNYILPVIFIVPIFLGIKGTKQRSINGFYMSMSIVPVGIMTAATWIRYGINAMGNFAGYVEVLVKSGISEGLADKLIYIGSMGGVLLMIAACSQLYLGIKNKDLFI